MSLATCDEVSQVSLLRGKLVGCWLAVCLVSWLVGCLLVGWFVCWLVGWLAGWLGLGGHALLAYMLARFA